MTTTASKFFFLGGIVALVAAAAYGWGTDGGMLGAMTAGFKGGAGELGGYTVLLAAAAVLIGLGVATSILRDADPEAQAATARLDVAPPVNVPSGPSYVPVLAAFSAVLAAVGLVASPVVFVIGLLLVLLCVLEWMVKAWSERATGDPEVNLQIRNRLMHPIETPVFAALGILVLVVSLSRIFLTLDRNATSVVAILIGALITGVAFLVAYRPKVSKDAIAVVLVVGALLAIGGGIIAAANGPRDFEHHDEEHEAGATAEEHSE
jgi:hypothetical protein